MIGYSALISSKTDSWATPQDLFDRLNEEFQFTLDPCATRDNAKCSVFFTQEDNGLLQKWNGRVFMNPPYGRAIGAWIKKAFESVSEEDCDLVVCLLPARTDTRWFHDYCIKGEIRFIKGRLKFGSSLNFATFPSLLIIFRKSI